jgi:PhoPQ-activated pathogenicity-related protein
MREFVTAVNEAYPAEQEVDEGNTFILDGKELRYYAPAEGQYMVFMASTSRHASNNEQVAGVVNFFIGLFDDESQTYLTERLMDRKDPFGIDMINQILDAMVEEWTGRPTKSPTASSRSPKTGGRKSTRPIQALTSSENRSTGS